MCIRTLNALTSHHGGQDKCMNISHHLFRSGSFRRNALWVMCAMLYICDSMDVDLEVLVSAGISGSRAAISVRNPGPHCNKWFITHSAGMQVPLVFAFVHLFSLLTQCVSKCEWWFHTSPCYQQYQSLCSSHMGITRVCVSSGSTLPSQASSVLLFPILITLRSEWDHFSSVQWPEEHRRQRGSHCMRHPCDGIIWAIRSSQRAQGSQRAPTALALATETESFVLLQASQVTGLWNAGRAFRISSFQGKEREVNAENSSSADYLALFSSQMFAAWLCLFSTATAWISHE